MTTLSSQVQNHKEAILLMCKAMGETVTPSQMDWLNRGRGQASRVAEDLTNYMFGTTSDSVVGRDHANGMETKFGCICDYSGVVEKAVSQTNPTRVTRWNRAFYAAVTGESTANKTGDIHLVIYDPFNKKLHTAFYRNGIDFTPGKQIRVSLCKDNRYSYNFERRVIETIEGFTRSTVSA